MNKAIQKSAEINVAAFRQAKKLIRVGMTERQIARLVGSLLRDFGAAKLAFPTIAALTENAAEPHHVPTDRVARVGDLLVLDMGGVYNNMRADMTRTLFFGKPRPQFVVWYNAVLQAQMRAYKGVRAGRTGESIDRIAREYLRTKNLSQYFIHSLGHGVGRAIHQPPWLSPRSSKGQTLLQVGDAVTIEPGVYLVGKGGVRIEDTCEVLANGARWLVPMQRDISRMVIPD